MELFDELRQLCPYLTDRNLPTGVLWRKRRSVQNVQFLFLQSKEKDGAVSNQGDPSLWGAGEEHNRRECGQGRGRVGKLQAFWHRPPAAPHGPMTQTSIWSAAIPLDGRSTAPRTGFSQKGTNAPRRRLRISSRSLSA